MIFKSSLTLKNHLSSIPISSNMDGRFLFLLFIIFIFILVLYSFFSFSRNHCDFSMKIFNTHVRNKHTHAIIYNNIYVYTQAHLLGVCIGYVFVDCIIGKWARDRCRNRFAERRNVTHL